MIKIALVFPGQGAQEVGMGKEFYAASPEAKAIFDQADAMIPGLTQVIFNGPPGKLTSTAYCQPGIFTFSLAALAAFKEHPHYKKIETVFACGLSLGELSALAAGGYLSFAEALGIVERRSFFMEEACRLKQGAMAAVIGMEKDALVGICEKNGVQVANFNSPEQIVITGEAELVQIACEKIREAGAKRVIPLEVSGAFHSRLMEPAVPPFSRELEKVSFKAGQFAVLSNVDAIPTRDPLKIKANLAKQITASVQWVRSVETIVQSGVTNFIEIGPGTVLKGLIRRIDKTIVVQNIQKPADLDQLTF